MFGGIVEGAYPVLKVEKREGLVTFVVEAPHSIVENVEVGASVSVDGVCLTVTAFDTNQQTLTFDMMQQTLALTTLGDTQVTDTVNLEGSLAHGAAIGGHIVSGHVDGVAEIVDIQQPPNNFVLTVRLPQNFLPYVFPKGFIAINGCSLTIAELNKETGHATVYLIPETLRKTNFGEKQIGDTVNFEVDRSTQAVVDTIHDVLRELASTNQISGEVLQQLTQHQQHLLEGEEDLNENT